MMANLKQVFKNEPVCMYAKTLCIYDGDIEVICGKCQHGTMSCYKSIGIDCSQYKPEGPEGKIEA